MSVKGPMLWCLLSYKPLKFVYPRSYLSRPSGIDGRFHSRYNVDIVHYHLEVICVTMSLERHIDEPSPASQEVQGQQVNVVGEKQTIINGRLKIYMKLKDERSK